MTVQLCISKVRWQNKTFNRHLCNSFWILAWEYLPLCHNKSYIHCTLEHIFTSGYCFLINVFNLVIIRCLKLSQVFLNLVNNHSYHKKLVASGVHSWIWSVDLNSYFPFKFYCQQFSHMIQVKFHIVGESINLCSFANIFASNDTVFAKNANHQCFLPL